jgi:hypothetical protein
MNEEWQEAENAGAFMTQEEKEKQFAEIFPDGKIAKYNWDLEQAKKLLQAVLDAITEDETIDGKNMDKMNDATRKALNALYAYVKPTAEHRTGLVFDANIYLAALTLHLGSKRGRSESGRFWSIRVEEVLASLLPTGYLRPHAQGIMRNSAKRTGCILSNNTSYFSFRRSSDFLPGSHFWVDEIGDGAVVYYRLSGKESVERFQSYVKQKTRARTDFMQQYSQPTLSSRL